ncbi:helix-turn-helix domain-containing protein, partial [Enterobacter kobei]|uniref:helix-turn-helix domain-containing protein n=1 Tax=Enterobacter kobei TaxID=208224 RepID=UPI00159ED111|nr:helix-turn-helix domain-containing protein [Enterobacter cloacae complex sp.]
MNTQITVAKTIGKRILNQRSSLRLSQDFLADHIGLTTETINNWETEKTVPFADQLIQLAKEGANKQVISSQADSLIKISRIWADFFPANTSNQPI